MEVAPTGRTGSTDGAGRPALTGAPSSSPAGGAVWALGAVWLATRVLVVLAAAGVLRISATNVGSDVSVLYHGWYEVLRTGTFPLDDATWQYPPGAALVILLPGTLPWSYAVSFLVVCGLFDALATGLLTRVGARRGRSFTGAWMWVAGVPLLGPAAYCRYDTVVTVVAVAGLLLVLRRPATGGILLGLGGLVGVWPLLAPAGTPRGRRTRRTWTAAGATAVALGLLLTAAMNGAFGFLAFRRERGVGVESLGALPLHFARLAGAWDGRVTVDHGSPEMVGPWVAVISRVGVAVALAGFGWLLVWRLRAVRWQPSTPFDAALAALLVFAVTGPVTGPQYLVGPVGLAAVCLTVRGSSQRPVAVLLLPATVLTAVEFPMLSGAVQHSGPWGVAVLTARDLLLAAAMLVSCHRLWRSTRGPGSAPTVVLPQEQPVQGYPVRPGIAYEQALLDDLDQPLGRPAPAP